MSSERLGPLSYDLTAPSGDADPARAVVTAIIVTTAVLVVGIVGGWFALGVVAKSAWFSTGVPLLVVVLPLAVAYRGSRHALRRTRMRALGAVLLITLFAAYLANHVLGSIKPALPQVRYALDSLTLPPGYTLLDETTAGDRFCRHGCPRVDRHYRAPASDADPVKTFILDMFDQGWHTTSDVPPDQATVAAKGDLLAQLANDGPILRISVVRRS